MRTIFDLPGRFWRGNLHTHSTMSDGALSPDDVCKRYKAQGYDFIALTDHFMEMFGYPITDTTGLRDAAFTTILGAELHSGAMENGELWHILAVGLPPDFTPTHTPSPAPVDGQESGAEVAARAREAGAFVAIAHPEWSGMSLADAQSITAAHAVEIYNHGCAVDCDRAHGFYILDRLLEQGRALTLCATDDAHFQTPDAFGGWVMVKAEQNDPDALLDALKAGAFYSSTGPEFRQVIWEDNKVIVESSAISTLIVQGKGSASTSVHGASMTRSEMALDRFAQCDWLRVTIVDAAGKRAWLNPHWR